jgi:hypothetical protein
VASAPASAATVFGSDLAAAPTSVFGANNVTLTNSAPRTGSSTPVTSPISGVLVRIRIRHGAVGTTPGRYAFRILSGTSPNYTARPATASGANETILWPANAPAGIANHIPSDADGRPKGVPIAAGERLALWQESQTSAPAILGPNGTGQSERALATDHTSGPATYTFNGNSHIYLQGVVEPDADADRYGDETQDGCPTDATVQTACPATTPDPEPDPPPDSCPADDQRLDDCTPPALQITAGPKAKTEKPKARFEFAADEAATFECALDKAGFVPCKAPKRYRGLDSGKHIFRLRAFDSNGNLSAPISKRWRVTRG